MEIKLQVKVNETVEVVVDVEDVIENINSFPLHIRMSLIASILNAVDVEDGELSEDHRKIILEYLEKQVIHFNKKKNDTRLYTKI